MRRKLTDFAQARLDMFESGLFGQGNAFWRWIATDEARPYLTAFAVDRAPPSGSEFFAADLRSEEHTSELQSLMRISYAVFCLKKKKKINKHIKQNSITQEQ